jgi:hypothetical protein
MRLSYAQLVPKVLVPKVLEFAAGRISLIIEVIEETSFTKKNKLGNKFGKFRIFFSSD